MILVDVNVLVYAHREDAIDHERFRHWLEKAMSSPAAYGMSELVLSGFVRIVTHPKVFSMPSPVADALDFCEQLRGRTNCVTVRPGEHHWRIFDRLVRDAGAKGNLVPDAYLAALAIEHGCEWITTDRDFARFAGLRWSHPLRSVAES